MRRRLALLAAAGAAAATIAAVSHDGGGAAQADPAAGPLSVQPQLGPGYQASLIGSTPSGTTGDPTEAWAFRQYPKDKPAPVVDGQPLPFAAGSGRQLVLLRHTSADGWRAIQTPADEQGNAYDGGTASPQAARATSRGGLAMLVDDGSRPAGTRHLLLAADRGERLRVVAAPDAAVLAPAAGADAAEALSDDVLAATDDGDHLVAYVGIEGRLRQTGVARWRDGAWTREPLCVEDATGMRPALCDADQTLPDASSLTAVALAADGDRAWLLARPAAASGRPLALFERVATGGGVRWALRAPDLPAGTDPLASPWALTATRDGVWIDGRLAAQDPATDLTAFYDGTHTTTWCDAAACAHPLGVRFGSPTSYRSFAWAGEGRGTRVVAPVVGGGDRSDAYAVFAGDAFSVRDAYNADSPSNGLAAFAGPEEGWVGNSHVTHGSVPVTQASWPVPVRRPITAIATAPGKGDGDLGAGALAVGQDGAVLRYTPGQGWDAEQLLGSAGVARDDLRGVAWPSAQFAFAVGDEGAMWRWDGSTGLWEADPGAPFDFQGHQLTGVAFQPGNPNRGYVVGRAGVLLRYDKSWVQDDLPTDARTTGPLGGPDDLFSIAFAGSQALVAGGRHLLSNDGGGWVVDPGAQPLIDRYGARVYAVAGLPDGGAVAAGSGGFVIERESAGAAWHLADQPLPNQPIGAVAAFRDGGQVRALASVVFGDTNFPLPDPSQLPITDPGEPAPALPPFDVPGSGTLMRQTAGGWRDEDRSGLRSPTADKARVADPALAFAIDGAGRGWVVGGWSGQAPTLTDSGATTGSGASAATASVARYATADPERAPGQAAAPVPTDAGPARLLVGGHAQCESACAGMDHLQLMPERTLTQAVAQANAMAAQPHGPRALLYTGGRVPPGDGAAAEPQAEADRLAALLGSGTSPLPVFAAVAPGDETGGTTAPFQRAFAAAPAPFGAAPAAGGTTPVAVGEGAAAGLARTHYAVDVATDGGPVRVVVLDNAAGSLAAADPHQNPVEPQLPWLQRVLADAKGEGIPVVAMGSRSLDPGDGREAAADATEVATALRDGGASAYVYDSPERSRRSTVPAGAGDGIPAIGTGTLGYRASTTRPGFDVPGLVLLELDATKRDAATNRAPATARLVPTLEDLVLEAVDGRVLNRSRPALFQGLGRRPRSGDRWSARNVGSSPYVDLPNPSCASFGCAGRIDPEVRFASSDPDIADFVRQDPASDNPRKPFVDPKTDKVVAEATSGLLCAFNPGTTTVSVSAGGLTYSTTVTVRGGSVLRPCGTTPSSTPTANAASTPSATPPPPPPAGSPSPAPASTPPAPVPPAPAAPPLPIAAAVVPAKPPVPSPFTPPAGAPPSVLATPPPPPGLSPRPIPPSGTSPVQSPTSVVQPASKVEKQREEEIAPEQQQSAVRYVPGHGNAVPPGALIALVLGAAMGGAGLRARHRSRHPDRGEELAMSYTTTKRSIR